MDNSEAAKIVVCEMPKEQSSLLLENNHQTADNSFISNDNPINLFKSTDQNINSENQVSTEKTDVSLLNAANVAPEINSVVPTDDSLSSLPPLPKDDKDSQPPVPYSADYNAQNYANYNYMYGNYSNYYGYPYPQYQWDYSSQQYYQPYQNYYNYSYNANQTQTSASKPPPPPPDSVQLPVEEKPSNKINTVTGDDSNRYSPTAETDDDDTVKGLPENKLDNITPQPVQTAKQLSSSVPFQTVSSEQAEIQKDLPGAIDSNKNNVGQPNTSLVTPTLQSVSAHLQQLNVPVQSSGYMINPQVQKQPTEVVNELKNQQQNPSVLNGKDDSVEKTSKGSTVLGKNQAKKRLMAFSMMKQKLQEQNSSINDSQSSDFVEGNDEFIPELNIFQTVQKKKVVANKKVTKVIKAQQTIEQIEEMKKDEMMQGNNAALYQHLLRSGGNEAPILQKLGIESLADKYSAKMKERGKRLKRHHHRHRDDRRGHKYHRRSHPKSRSRSRSAEKPKMRALDVKSWKDFVSGGFQFDKFRRFKMDEAEELKDKERKSRTKKKHGDSQSDGKHQNAECILLTEAEKSNGDLKLRYNLLDRKKEILKGLEVVTQEADCTKDFPSYIIRMTKTKPVVKFSHNPAVATYHLQNRQQMLETLLPEIEAIVHKFFSSIKPKKLKENSTDFNFNSVDDKLLLMMNNKNVYPFKGWWPKTYFIMTQVKENPNIEVDRDALLNAVPTSKRTKKSRFDDNTSLTDLRPTVPSKWDSDYDDSPVIDKIVDSEVSQHVEINTNNTAVINNREEIKTLDIIHQEEPMDTASDIGDDEPKIEVNVYTHALPQEPQSHAKLDTEYEEFLKIACVEKNDKSIDMTFLKVNDNDLSIKSVLLNESVQDDSEDDTSSKSSDESISLHNATEESTDQLSFVKSLSSFDIKSKKKKKVSNKKSKKLKKKLNKKKSHNSSSSESSLESESDSDSTSEDSESETSDSISTVEKKKKKSVSKDKKKKKSKTKKKHKSDKCKTKKPEDKKNLLNLLQKALIMEAKMKERLPESDESKQKKKKRKHEKKIEDHKNTLSCDKSSVSDVLKYFKMDEGKEQKKKLKKNLKRKFDSDDSNNDKSSKKGKFNDSLISKDSNEKKKKSKKKKLSDRKCDDLDEHLFKNKSKRKSKTSDSSETEDDKESHKKSKNDKDSDYFFGPRPNEWNKNNKSSMRGVVHHSAKITNHSPSTSDMSRYDNEKSKNHKPFCVKHECVCFSHCSKKNVCNDDSSIKKVKMVGQLNVAKESIEIIKDNRLSSGREKVKINSKNSKSTSDRKNESVSQNNENVQRPDLFDNNIIEHEVGILQTSLPTKKYEQKDLIKDQKNVLKFSQNKSLIQNHNDEPPDIILMPPSIPLGQTISHRNKVKMNLKNLLYSSQNIPLEFVCSSPLGSIRPKYFEIEKNESFELNQKKNQEVNKSEKLDDSIEFATLSSPTIHTKSSNSVLPISDMEINNQVNYRSFNWEDSEDSSSHQSSVKSVNISDHLTNEDEISKLKTPHVLDCMNIKNKQHKFGTLSNVSDVKELWHTIEVSKESYIGVDSKIKEQKCQLNSDVESSVKEEMTSPSNLEFSHAAVLENNGESILVALSKKNYCDSLNSQHSSNDSEVYKNDNELITQWTSDWSRLVDESIIKINNSDNYRSDDTKKFLIKKKSRWDEQPKNDEISDQPSLNNEQIELKDDVSNYTTDSLDTSNSTSNVKSEFSDGQNQLCEITSLNSMSDNVEYDNYSENLSNDYESYNQYSCKPQYSEMKTLEDSHLSPVDYSIYENYNPNYDYQDEDYDTWKALDTSNDLNIIPTTDETQVGNILETLPSTEGAELLKEEELNDGVLFDVQDIQNDEILTHKNSDSICREQQFSQVYQIYVKHYSQNPIKYSTSNPLFDIKTKVNVDAVEESPSQEELSDIDQVTDDEKIPLPLRQRAYVCVVEDNNSNVYLTNDNFMAYCAVEDKCFVHIALDVCSLDSTQDQARHCFNINQNGTVDEYWLHADLIPYYNPSDAECGVFSDDENDSTGSGSGHEDHANGNDSAEDNSDDTILGEWEIVDSDSDADSWLNDPNIIQKYGEENNINIDGVEQTVTDVNQEEYVTNSPEYGSDTSDVSDSDNKTRSSHLSENQNITQSLVQNINENKDNVYETQDFDVSTSAKSNDVLKQTYYTVTNSNLLVKETHGNSKLPSAVESENYDDLSITSNGLTSNIKMEDIVNSCKLNKNGNEPGIFQKEELKIDDLIMLNNIINQQMFIQRLKMQSKERIQKKLPETVMFSYSDNMEIVKHPFLGLFQPPTTSVLVKQRKVKVPGVLKLVKHVTFADGINPGTALAKSPEHATDSRPLSPIPLKTLMRESLKLNPFIKSKKKCIKLSMVCKKVAKVTPSVKSCIPTDVKYYIRQSSFEDLAVAETTANNNIEKSEDSPLDSDDDDDHSGSMKVTTPPSPTREVTPVPSDNDFWDEDGINNNHDT